MKKIMLIGKVGSGKTTLCQRIYNLDMTYKKTQAVEIVGGTAIDTPGEYLEHRSYLKALMVSGVDAEVLCGYLGWRAGLIGRIKIGKSIIIASLGRPAIYFEVKIDGLVAPVRLGVALI